MALPPGPPLLASATLAAASPTAGSGWFYNLLTRAGVDPSTANTVVEFVWRPLVILLVALIAFLVAALGAHAIRRVLGRAAATAAKRSGSPRASARAATVVALAANLFKFTVAVVAIFIVLGMLGVNVTPLLASATVIGATLGFGAQALVRDYLSGFLLTMEDQFGIGDAIEVNDISGVVEDLSLRVTRVRAADGTVWYVPNGDIRKVANRSRGWAKAVVDLPVGPPGPTGLEEIERSLAEAAQQVASSPRFAASCSEAPVVLGVVGSDATTCTIRVTLRTTPSLRDPLERALRQALVERLSVLHRWPVTDAVAAGDSGAAGGGAADAPSA
jgi:small conductance mechanosensitive channel